VSERETRLIQENSLYEALMTHNPSAIAFQGLDGNVVLCNPAFERLFGYTKEEATGRNLDDLIATEETQLEAVNFSRRALQLGDAIRTESQRRKKDGTILDVVILGLPVMAGGKRIGALAIYTDTSGLKRVEAQLQQVYSSFVYLLDGIEADVYVADMVSYEILFMNKHMRDSFGGNFTGQLCYKVFRGEDNPCAHCTNGRLLDASGKPTGVHTWESLNPKTGRWYKNSDRAILWEGGRYVRLEVATDITELKQAEMRLEHLATHDSLTGLPNRTLFNDRLRHAIEIARRAEGYLGILFLDLDNFKEVNDNFGHARGDDVLRVIGNRMRGCLRAGDTVAHISGDEFALIVEQQPKPEDTYLIAEKVGRAISEPIMMEGREIRVTASVGISVYPLDAQDEEGLLNAADQAMYTVKARGKNGYARYGEAQEGEAG
jgi:diguanylate cyclase (GGDEF)-like protein/PAS domain S-box-containing protein